MMNNTMLAQEPAYNRSNTTWEYILDTSLPLSERACVLCGGINMRHRRSVNIGTLMKAIGNSNDSVAVVMKAMLTHKIHKKRIMEAQATDILCACASCYYWTFRSRRKKPNLPLQSLLWYMRTLDGKYKRFTDARVLHRMAAVLINARVFAYQDLNNTDLSSKQQTILTKPTPQNYFLRVFFSGDELDCLKKISMDGTRKVHGHIADLYWNQNANPLFVKQLSTAENLRKFGTREGSGTSMEMTRIEAVDVDIVNEIRHVQDMGDMEDMEDTEDMEDMEDMEEFDDFQEISQSDEIDAMNAMLETEGGNELRLF